MKFLIVNQHTGNFGDDLAGVSLIQQILSRFPNSTVDIMYRTPKGSINYFDNNVFDRHDLDIGQNNRKKFIIYMLLRLVGLKLDFYNDAKVFSKEIENYDKIIVSPAGANIGIYTDWLYLLRLVLIVKSGKTVLFHGNTIGKSKNKLFNLLSKYVLRHSIIYSRELKTTAFLKQENIHAIQTVDTAFLFNKTNEKLKFPNVNVNQKNDKYIVLIPTQLTNWHPSFKNWDESVFMDKFLIPQVKKLADETNAKVVILKHLHSIYEEDNYLTMLARKLTQFGVNDVEVPDVDHFTIYNSFISQAIFVISMRYHGVVMSILNHTPFISLSYENKMTEVANYSGFGELNHSILELSKQNIEFIDEYEKAREKFENTDFHELDTNLTKYATGPLDQVSFLEKGSVR